MQQTPYQRKQSQPHVNPPSTSTPILNRTSQTMTIKIKTMNGMIYMISNIPSSLSISALQIQVQDKTGVPVQVQRLLYKAVLLQPGKYISDYGITDNSTIQLVANMLPQQISSPSISTHRHSEVARTQALTQQQLRTKKHRYLQQRINGFSMRPLQSIQAMKQNKITIDRLIQNLNNGSSSSSNGSGSNGHHVNKNNNNNQYQATYANQVINTNTNNQSSVNQYNNIIMNNLLFQRAEYYALGTGLMSGMSLGYGFKDRLLVKGIILYKCIVMGILIDGINGLIKHHNTVQSEDSPYLSPFPRNKPQLKLTRNPQPSLSQILQQIPQTLSAVCSLFSQLSQQKHNYNMTSVPPKFKYSFNQQQQFQQQQQQLAQSLRNNRSHHSPPQSIHQQEYQYQYQIEQADQDQVQGRNNYNYNYNWGGVKGSIGGGIGASVGLGDANNNNYNYQHKIVTNKMKKQSSGSIKGGVNHKSKNTRKVLGSNKYIDTKKIHIGYSKTKSQHEHTLNRQQTPNKINPNSMVDQLEQKPLQSPLPSQPLANNSQAIATKQYQMDLQQQKQQKQQNTIGNPNPSSYVSDYTITQLPEQMTPNSATKQPSNIQTDNMSNKCQQNMSNKGDHDDGESSAKSFGSKRSDRFMDASSMKSLNIDTLNYDAKEKEKSKDKELKKNILIFDNSQAQSVRSAAQNQRNKNKSTYFNQEGILEQQDSQINQQMNEQYYAQKKKQTLRKLRATQLAPICDRLGRMLVDLAPHLAKMGFQQYKGGSGNYNNNGGNLQYSENLSTYTNEGSLQSRLKRFGQNEAEDQQASSKNSNRYYNFQIPVMLTPYQIAKINKFLSQEGREAE